MSNSNTNRERRGSEFEFDVYAQRPRVGCIISFIYIKYSRY